MPSQRAAARSSRPHLIPAVPAAVTAAATKGEVRGGVPSPLPDQLVEVATATVVAPPNASARPAGATIAKTPQFEPRLQLTRRRREQMKKPITTSRRVVADDDGPAPATGERPSAPTRELA